MVTLRSNFVPCPTLPATQLPPGQVAWPRNSETPSNTKNPQLLQNFKQTIGSMSRSSRLVETGKSSLPTKVFVEVHHAGSGGEWGEGLCSLSLLPQLSLAQHLSALLHRTLVGSERFMGTQGNMRTDCQAPPYTIFTVPIQADPTAA